MKLFPIDKRNFDFIWNSRQSNLSSIYNTDQAWGVELFLKRIFCVCNLILGLRKFYVDFTKVLWNDRTIFKTYARECIRANSPKMIMKDDV